MPQEDFNKIESREKRRLKNKQIKLQKELDLLGEYKEDFNDFIIDFDMEMDFLANQANFENGYKTEYQELLTDRINKRSDNDIFARSTFKMPSFHKIGSKDVEIID